MLGFWVLNSIWAGLWTTAMPWCWKSLSKCAVLPVCHSHLRKGDRSFPLPPFLVPCTVTPPDFGALTKLRTAVVDAVWNGRSSRAPEAVCCLFFPSHRFDPTQACHFQVWCTLRRMCRQSPGVVVSISALRLLHPNAPSNVCGPVHTVMQTLKALKWFWDDLFKRPFLLPTAWIKCSKGWFQHQGKNALRQVQMSTLASRATHYFGLQFFDRDSTGFLLNNLLSKKQSYAAGTLKAILANAVRTAVVFPKCGAAASAICPFCSSEVVEDTHHLCDVCPKWLPIRDKWSKKRAFAASTLHLAYWCRILAY